MNYLLTVMIKDTLFKLMVTMVTEKLPPTVKMVACVKNDFRKTNKYFTSKILYTITYILNLCCEL